MAAEGVDYAWDRPNLDQLWAAGKRFVCRYLAYDGTNGYARNGKVLQAAELAALHARGFAVVLNWEQTQGDMMRGRAKGVEHAREALRQANALGAPATIPVYFSCDKDTSRADETAVAAYLDGAASVLGRGRVGVYGEFTIIEAMVPAHAAWGWGTYAWSGKNADGTPRVSGKAHLWQYSNGVQLAGADLDLNRQLKPDIGAWRPNQLTSEDDVQLDDVVQLPVGSYPEGGASATVGTILGYTNGRVIRLEAAIAEQRAAAAADADRDAVVLAAVKALSVAFGADPQPVLDAIASAHAETSATHDLLVQVQQQLAAIQARNLKLAAALAAAGVALDGADS